MALKDIVVPLGAVNPESARIAWLVTPDDANDLPFISRGIAFAAAGAITANMEGTDPDNRIQAITLAGNLVIVKTVKPHGLLINENQNLAPTVRIENTGMTNVDGTYGPTIGGSNTNITAIIDQSNFCVMSSSPSGTYGVTSVNVAAAAAIGSAYVIGDVLTAVGESGTATQATVSAVDGNGGIIAVFISRRSTVQTLQSQPLAVPSQIVRTTTGGTGTGASITVYYDLAGVFMEKVTIPTGTHGIGQIHSLRFRRIWSTGTGGGMGIVAYG